MRQPAIAGFAEFALGYRSDAGHDLTLGQMPVAYPPRPSFNGQLVGMDAK